MGQAGAGWGLLAAPPAGTPLDVLHCSATAPDAAARACMCSAAEDEARAALKQVVPRVQALLPPGRGRAGACMLDAGACPMLHAHPAAAHGRHPSHHSPALLALPPPSGTLVVGCTGRGLFGQADGVPLELDPATPGFHCGASGELGGIPRRPSLMSSFQASQCGLLRCGLMSPCVCLMLPCVCTPPSFHLPFIAPPGALPTPPCSPARPDARLQRQGFQRGKSAQQRGRLPRLAGPRGRAWALRAPQLPAARQRSCGQRHERHASCPAGGIPRSQGHR